MAAIYSDVILDHFRNPRNYGALHSPDVAHEDVNPLCGDRIRIELRIKDGIVEAVRFRGDGCAISIASASILTELVLGANLCGREIVGEDRLLSSLQSKIKRSRIKCAMLPLEVLRVAVDSYFAR
ncbi:MAG TPA: iron-sulfur cluster assembly scaffold protein [Blastocatellia bacterium]|nr:iron-sulfur cluster assembly scaffold protein [Blastocatellia bacterium]